MSVTILWFCLIEGNFYDKLPSTEEVLSSSLDIKQNNNEIATH